MIAGLTKRQLDCLRFIVAYIDEHTISPSYLEIRKGLGLASTSGVCRLINALQERGYVAKSYMARSISILRPAPGEDPEPACPACEDELAEGVFETVNGVAVVIKVFRCRHCDGGRKTVETRAKRKAAKSSVNGADK